jgi:hypothetical protein
MHRYSVSTYLLELALTLGNSTKRQTTLNLESLPTITHPWSDLDMEQ